MEPPLAASFVAGGSAADRRRAPALVRRPGRPGLAAADACRRSAARAASYLAAHCRLLSGAAAARGRYLLVPGSVAAALWAHDFRAVADFSGSPERKSKQPPHREHAKRAGDIHPKT